MPQFSYTYDGLTVYEGATAFYLSNGTNEACLGDGVDMFTSDTGESIMVDTEEFYSAMRDWLSSLSGELREIYGL